MTTELTPKVIGTSAPVTLAECVYIGDGTTTTVKEVLENIQSSGGSGGGGTGDTNIVNVSGNVSVEGGNVFFEKTNTREITYSSGFLLINGKIYKITNGSVTAKDYTEWNPGNPNYTTYFVYNITSLSFAFRGAYQSNPALQDGDYIIFISYSDTTNSYFKTLSYDNRYIKQKQLPYEKLIKRLTIIGDSLTAVGKWYEVVDNYDTKLKVLSKNIQAVSGATLYSQGLGYAGNVSQGDIVILFMGTNDCLSEVTLGDPATDTSNSDTFCGKFKKVIETIYDIDKTIRMLVVCGSPLNGYRFNESKPKKYYNDVIQYSNATREMCKQYCLPCLNLLENIGINSYNTSETQIDGCHYSADMYKRLGNLIFEKLYSIL